MNILGFYVAGSGKAGYVKKDIIMQEMKCSWEEASEYYKEINKNKVLVSKQEVMMSTISCLVVQN